MWAMATVKSGDPIFILLITFLILAVDVKGIYYTSNIGSSQVPKISKDSTPSWYYDGMACTTKEGLVNFDPGTKKCSFFSDDQRKVNFDCTGTRMTCRGQSCPSRACGIAARRMATAQKAVEIKRNVVGFREMEPRMVKQQGSIPPLRIKTTPPASPFGRSN